MTLLFILFIFSFIFISWRLIILQYCSGFCHTLISISHGITCIPHPDPPSHLPLHPIPLGLVLNGESPGSSVVRTQSFYCCESSSISVQGTEIPQAMQRSQKKKKKEIKTKTVLNALEFKHLKLVGDARIERYSYNPQSLIAV